MCVKCDSNCILSAFSLFNPRAVSIPRPKLICNHLIMECGFFIWKIQIFTPTAIKISWLAGNQKCSHHPRAARKRRKLIATECVKCLSRRETCRDPLSDDRLQFNASIFTNDFCGCRMLRAFPKIAQRFPLLCIWIILLVFPALRIYFLFLFRIFGLPSCSFFGCLKTSSACANFGLNGNELERHRRRRRSTSFLAPCDLIFGFRFVFVPVPSVLFLLVFIFVV